MDGSFGRCHLAAPVWSFAHPPFPGVWLSAARYRALGDIKSLSFVCHSVISKLRPRQTMNLPRGPADATLSRSPRSFVQFEQEERLEVGYQPQKACVCSSGDSCLFTFYLIRKVSAPSRQEKGDKESRQGLEYHVVLFLAHFASSVDW